ncbi:uncharacterized protein RHOBADRAFT_55059 [Rhodotorula graminis WP1]|uniref:Uncharacterized protein n=1 Tax=Rhodotorula graminis (strain WP1) TaxID=578459 RepID=A0A0P9EN08_RHOGW|nr:uncharacterized protein RHOBADRAFT_55059 [Rhodotorula graminis WP1]KPV73296.1 hypothetical protein RHOBADRAFT_55059 [Rhodotorula graminis WP1]
MLWLAYVVKESRFVANLPFHLFPPNLPAQFVHLPHAGSSGERLEAFTARSDPSGPLARRLAYCEDAVHLPASDGARGNALVLVSCDPQRRRWNTVMAPLADPHGGQGALWVVDALGRDDELVHQVELEWAALERGEVEFHPLGIALVPPVGGGDDADDGVRLFAVNHGAARSTIEVFSLSPVSPSPHRPLGHRATHLFTLSHPSLSGAPNSIAPLSRTSFLVSHDHRHTRRRRSLVGRLANFVETVGALPYGRVDYVAFDEPVARKDAQEVVVRTSTVARGISFANGLALSPGRETLVVASTSRRQLLFYDVRASSSLGEDVPPTLTLRRTVTLPILVDNLSLLPSSPNSTSLTVLAAGHPSYPALLSAAHGLSLRLRLPGPLREWAATLGARDWEEWDVRLRADEQRGMSWAVAVRDPPLSRSAGGEEGHEEEREAWETVYQSSGRIAEGGFGGSTTAVAGVSAAAGEERAWLVVVGLYEEGVRSVRQ